ncbi:MAG: hypothetical protein HYW78_02535 [Parcubacteria group bacterium]|nr:hypothetical protein [Parcubacteria group bacterium]
MQQIDDKTLITVLQTLFKEIKNGIEKNEYYVFPPTAIEIRGKRNIHFGKVGGTVNDLRSLLQELGKTAYTLVTGEPYQVGRASQQQTQSRTLWFFISLLLSGNAYDIPKTEKILDDLKKETSWWYASLYKIKTFLSSCVQRIKRVASATTLPTLKDIIEWLTKRDDYSRWRINKLLAVPLAIAFIVEIVWYSKFNYLFSNEVGIIFIIATFLTALSILYFIAFYNDDDRSLLFANDQKLFVPLVVVIMTLFPLVSFCAPILKSIIQYEDNKTCVKEYAVVIDKKSDSFVARLPLKKDDKILTWNSSFINHFKYKIVPGIPMEGQFVFAYTITVKKGYSYEFTKTIYYRINEKIYPRTIMKWKNKSNLDRYIAQKISDSISPEMNRYTKKLLEIYPLDERVSNGSIVVSISPAALTQTPTNEKKLEWSLEIYFKQELEKMNLLNFDE